MHTAPTSTDLAQPPVPAAVAAEDAVAAPEDAVAAAEDEALDARGIGVSDTTQEVRVAVAMSGGVSLAVWMGGVAREVNLLQQASNVRQHESAAVPVAPAPGRGDRDSAAPGGTAGAPGPATGTAGPATCT